MMKKQNLTLAQVSLHTSNPMHLRAQQTLKAQIFKNKKAYTRRPKHKNKYYD